MKRLGYVMLAAAALACGLWAAQKAAAPAAKKAAAKKTGAGAVTWDYQKVTRDQITHMMRGQADAVITQCEPMAAQSPDDLEMPYLLALAYAHKGQADKAMEYVRKALAGGLPIERFLAGPRDAAKPLLESPAFQALAREKPVQLLHGPMLGRVTDGAAAFWVRTLAEVPVQAVVSQSPKLQDPVRSPDGRTAADRDFTAVVAVSGLKPDTTYYYDVLVDGQSTCRPPKEFRTFPKAGSPAKFEVAFGGGAGWAPLNERMWTTVAGHKPLALLLLGDNVYIDTPEVPATQRYCYYRRRSRPEFRHLVGGTPVFAIYDDHDFGDNDCVPGPAIDDPPWKRAVLGVFTENWVNPAYGGGHEQPGCWFEFSIGNVDFFMLDCRYYRDLKGNPPSMLGPAQKARFLKVLKGSKGTFRVLASSVPWASGTKPGSKDTWDGFPEEREEILSFLEANQIGGVVLLSADRHRSDVWKIPRKGYDLYEFETSKLTNIHTHPEMPQALFSYNKKDAAGFLEFDTTAADPQVTYRIISIDDEVIHTFTVKRSQLTPK
jgi:alkaline phosphatase D